MWYASLMLNDTHLLDDIIRELLRIRADSPELRVGQIIAWCATNSGDVFNMQDQDLLQALQRYPFVT